MVTKENLFSFKGNAAESKAAATDKAFRAIVEAEAKSRDAKTERLRKARVEKEKELAANPVEKPKAKKTRKSG